VVDGGNAGLPEIQIFKRKWAGDYILKNCAVAQNNKCIGSKSGESKNDF
jgi:hypothetical protein